MKRDSTKIDPSTKKPYCYGNESPVEGACLSCRFSVVCREVGNMKKGSPVTPVIPPVSEEDFVVDQYDDEEDENGVEA